MTQIERTPEEIATEIAKSAAKVAMVRAMYAAVTAKTASAPGQAVTAFTHMLPAAAQGATLGAAAGGIVGGASAGEGHRLEGAARGAMGGAVAGGLGGAALHAGGFHAEQNLNHLRDDLMKTMPPRADNATRAEYMAAQNAHFAPVNEKADRAAQMLLAGQLGAVPLAGGLAGYAAAPREEKQASAKTAGMEGIGGLTWRQLAPVVGQGAALGTVAGGVTGAMAGGEGHRAEGALRGAAGGALLGGLGSAGMVGLRSHIGKSTADEYWALQGMAGKPEFPAAEEAFWKRFERNNKMLGMGELGGPVATGAIGGGIGGALARPGTPEQPKTASIGSVFGRALGGAAAGGLLGGGAGALAAHMRGGDVRQSAMTGALGGAGLGAGLGALSTGVKPGDLEKLRHRQFGTASTALLGGAGALFGKKLVGSLVGGEDSEAAEARQKELGRFEAMQQIKVKQLALLEPMHAAAFEHAQQDEIISRADPALVHSSFETMKRFAPNIAADPNAVRSFLRESASWGAGPSYATLKNLADAERSVAGAGGAV